MKRTNTHPRGNLRRDFTPSRRLGFADLVAMFYVDGAATRKRESMRRREALRHLQYDCPGGQVNDSREIVDCLIGSTSPVQIGKTFANKKASTA